MFSIDPLVYFKTSSKKMSYNILFFLMTFSFCTLYSEGCLITNCPNGGKRGSSFGVANKGVSISKLL